MLKMEGYNGIKEEHEDDKKTFGRGLITCVKHSTRRKREHQFA
jgi:hypothetical protein